MPRGISAINAIWRERQQAALRAQEATPHGTHTHHGYDPNQPRVPAGNPDGGQWTETRRGTGIQLAAADKPRFPGMLPKLLWELAMLAIMAYRSGRLLEERDTVAVTTLDGDEIFGANSTSRDYKMIDRFEAVRMRNALIRKYPDVMKQENIGQKPNDALFHAETTVLLRAARQNRGTLKGRTLEVYVDRSTCDSCRVTLPYVGLELGNPTVTFIGPAGRIRTMKDGDWLPQEKGK